MKEKGQLVPPKRYGNTITGTFYFKIVQLLRMYTRKNSLEIWKETKSAILFDQKMKKKLFLLSNLTQLYHYKQDNRAIFTLNNLAKIIKKIFRKYN